MSSRVLVEPGLTEVEGVSRAAAPVRWRGASALPPVSWNELEAALLGLAAGEDRRFMVRHLLQAARAQADRLSPAELVREIVCIGAIALGATPADDGTAPSC